MCNLIKTTVRNLYGDSDLVCEVAYLSDVLLRLGSRAKVSKMAAAIKNRIRLDASPALNEWVKPVES